MTRYRRVETGTFNDDRFRELAAPPPGGQWLWINLLCGARTTIYPGLVVATEAVLASDMRWPVASDQDDDPEAPPCSLRGAWRQLAERGMVTADWEAGVVVLPKALLDRRGSARESARPTSPNAFRGWAKSWGDVPECALSAWYLAELGRFVEALDRDGTAKGGNPDPYQRAYREAFATPLERVRDAYPDALSGASLESVRGFNMFATRTPTRTPTRSRPTRDPVPVSGSGSSEPRSSGSPPDPARAPDPGPVLPVPAEPPAAPGPARSPDPRDASASPAPTRRAYPPKAQPTPVAGRSPLPGDSADLAQGVAPGQVPAEPPRVRAAGEVQPDAEAIARRELGNAGWERLNSIRAAVALERGWSDVRPLHPMDPGRAELNERLRESGASGAEVLEHVLRVAESEARTQGTVRWLSGAIFGERQWRRFVAMRPDDSATPARAPASGGARTGARTRARAEAREVAGARAALERERRMAEAEAQPPPDSANLSDAEREELNDLARRLGITPIVRPPPAPVGDRDPKPDNAPEPTDG